MKMMMGKAPPKNSTKERFIVVPRTLNSHNKDPRRVNNHQNIPSNQEAKSDVCDCSREKCVYTLLTEGKHAYVRNCQGKTRVYVSKHNQTKERLRNSDSE
jgi:hypothetical protein